jgi:oligopeptide/dipeptide ABC transporter ATP-binding protein
MTAPLLEILALGVARGGDPPVSLIEQVSLCVPAGRVVALVGESGCGKSLTALAVLRLLPRPAVRVISGRILWHGGPAPRPEAAPLDLLSLSDHELCAIRGRDIAMVFQEPMSALNPVYPVGDQIAEVLLRHQRMSRRDAWREAVRLLDQIGIADAGRRACDFPHQFSGGMRQRVLLAMSIACRPQLLIADEPTTALDVTIQAQILELMRELQMRVGMSMLLITHDLGVVAAMADEVYVMYAGRIVEHANTAELLTHPLHPYTQGLLACTPRMDSTAAWMTPIPGSVPDPGYFPGGCRFHPRCELSASRARGEPSRMGACGLEWVALRRCMESYGGEPSGRPPMREHRPGHFSACWEIDDEPENANKR